MPRQDIDAYKDELTGLEYIAEPATFRCQGCAFVGNIGACIESPPCMDVTRQDGKDIIWSLVVK